MSQNNPLDLFEYIDYREYIKTWIRLRPKNGHGQLRKLALHLRMAPVTITQILRNDRELPLEMAPLTADFLLLTGLAKKYFIKLVMYSRAGNHDLQAFIFDEIQQLQKDSQNLKNRVPSEVELSEADLAIFHSSWIYSAVRLSTSIENLCTCESISNYLNIPMEKTQSTLDFLVSRGLCRFEKNKYIMGPSRTHLPESSPFIIPRQSTWRSKAGEKMSNPDKTDLYYTAPMSLSKEDLPRIRREILLFIDRINSIVGPSKSETVSCINIDWFKL
ncbi:MAG: TIGR02147 family protein [Pseudobdellovibrio sp.]